METRPRYMCTCVDRYNDALLLFLKYPASRTNPPRRDDRVFLYSRFFFRVLSRLDRKCEPEKFLKEAQATSESWEINFRKIYIGRARKYIYMQD